MDEAIRSYIRIQERLRRRPPLLAVPCRGSRSKGVDAQRSEHHVLACHRNLNARNITTFAGGQCHAKEEDIEERTVGSLLANIRSSQRFRQYLRRR